MNPMRIIVLVIALVAAGGAALLLGGFLGNKKQATAAPGPATEWTEVLVASKDMDVGTRLTAQDLKWQKWPKDGVSSAFKTRDTDPGALESMVGAVARSMVFSGEPATDAKMVKSENSSFMAALLSPGMRAVSVEIKEETGAGGFILPNDRVDVIVSMDAGSGEDGSRRVFTRTILQNIRVLAVGSSFRDNNGTAEADTQNLVAKTATLEVSPAEADLLQQAATAGTVSLALRGLTESDTPVASIRTPSNVGPQRSSTTITIIRHGTPTQVQATN